MNENKDDAVFENVLNMKEAKEKLNNLCIDNDVNNMISEFGKFLSGRLNDELVPIGFVSSCELALYDLSKGINGYTDEPIQNNLVGYPNIIYNIIRMNIPEIAKNVFPNDFAQEVCELMKK